MRSFMSLEDFLEWVDLQLMIIENYFNFLFLILLFSLSLCGPVGLDHSIHHVWQ